MHDQIDWQIKWKDPELQELEIKLQKHLKYQTTLGQLIADLLLCEQDDRTYCFKCHEWNWCYEPFWALEALNQWNRGLLRCMVHRNWLTEAPKTS